MNLNTIKFWGCFGLAILNVFLCFVGGSLRCPELQTLSLFNILLFGIGMWLLSRDNPTAP
jgi:hypothetical protein